MAINVGELVAYLRLDNKGFSQGLKEAGTGMTNMQKATDKTFKLISKAAKIAFVAVSGAIIKSVVDATKFEKEMANIATMLDKRTLPMLGKFKKDILTAGKTFGEGTKTLTKGLYDILSASIPAEKAIEVLTVSVRAAKAGMTDTGVAADAITTLINAFGDSADNANYYSDILFATVKRGKTTFGELAGSIGTVATLSAQAGVSVQELGAMMAIMTRNGLDSSIASTALRGAITGLLKPTEDAIETARSMGIEFGLSALKAHGLEGVMNDLAGLPADVLTKLFPNVRGLTAVITAAGSMGDEMKIFTDIMAAGSPTMEAWEKQSGTMQVAWDRLKATFSAVSIGLGDRLLPSIKEITDAFRQWLDENQERIITFTKNMLDNIVDLVKGIGEWKEVIIAVGGALAGLMIAQKVSTVIIALNAAIAAGSGPIGLAIAGLSALVYVLLKVAKNARTMRDEQGLIDSAMNGSAQAVEDYDAAINVLNERIKERQKALKAMTEDENTAILYGQRFLDQKEGEINALKNNISAIDAYRDAKIDAEIKIEERMRIKANAEMVAYIAEQQRVQDQIIADETREQSARDAARAEKERLATIEQIMLKLADARMTDEERIKQRAKVLKQYGFQELDIIDTLKIEYADYYAEKEKNKDQEITGLGEVDDYLKAQMALRQSMTEQYEANLKKEVKATEKSTDANFDLKKSFKDLQKGAGEWSDFLATSFTAAFESAFDITKTMSENIKSAVKDLFSTILKAIGRQLIIAAVGYALLLQWGKAAAAVAGSIAAFTGAMIIDALEAGGLVGDKLNKKKIVGKADGGLFQGKPGIDTNMVALTSGEYVVNKEATAKNMDSLEAINSGEGGGSVIIKPMPLYLRISDKEVGSALIDFITVESDRGSFRINPKVIRSNI